MTGTQHRALIFTPADNPQIAEACRLLSDAMRAVGIDTTCTTDVASLKAPTLQKHNVVVLLGVNNLDGASVEQLGGFVGSGGGLVAIGCADASASPDHASALGRLLGARPVQRTGPVEIKLSPRQPDHPINHRLSEFRLSESLLLVECAGDCQVLWSFYHGGRCWPLACVRREGGGRVVYLGVGSTAAAMSQPTLRQLATRAVRFAGGEDWSQRTVKVAAIGYGGAFNMGKLHLESCARARMKPVAVCDLDPNRLATAKAELGQHIQTYTKLEDLLGGSDAELCIVITPHNTHAAIAIQCLQAGRHVVTEKPFTITVAEATNVIETARRAGKMATVFHNRRWDGDFMAIKRVIDSGLIGEVFHIECFFGGYGEPRADWWRSSKRVSGGAFYDWGAHFADWVLNLMPYRIESISGSFHKRVWHAVDIEDHTEAFIRFEGGRTAHIQQSSIAAIARAKFRILGTRGGIELPPGMKDMIRVVSYRNGVQHDGTVPTLKSDWDGFYRNVADHLILGEPLAVTPESARKVIAVLSLAEESSNRGGAPLPPPFEQ
ncbi:Gfo/Idh/MocA family protein [Fontivita pretiosa]|uniref:Gfo/Idh/MocA family protein n=1 Tax=Fontivita pretiosa TaxID=2989684 RepID=UPI003D1789CF